MAVAAHELVELGRLCRRLATEAGQLLLERQSQPRTIEYKDQHGSDPVTDADRAVEEYLRSELRRYRPGDAVLGEEGGPAESGQGTIVWALDPLDGTANFAAGLPCYAVSVAVLADGAPLAGAIAVPPLQTLFHAVRGGGCFRDDRPVRAHAGERLAPGAPVGLFAGWRSAFTAHGEFRTRPGEPRAFGSIAAEIGLVAEGSLQYAIYAAPKLWDVAAGALLVVEAGGTVRLWRAGRWAPFERFDQPGSETGWRGWSLPVLVGGSGIVPLAAAGLQPRHRLLWGRLLKRLLPAPVARH